MSKEMAELLIAIGTMAAFFFGYVWLFAYSQRRHRRRRLENEHARQEAVRAKYPRRAQEVVGPIPGGGRPRDAGVAAFDTVRGMWRIAKNFLPAPPPDRYQPSPRCEDCNTCIVDPGKCWTCQKKTEPEHCHSGRDGDCNWEDCPQEANNRANYQSYCPLAVADEARRGDES